jgi:hypothetical protein
MTFGDALAALRAGLDRDEQIALAASPNAWRPDIWQNQHGREFLVVADVAIGAPAFAISDESNAKHIARQDPATTLRRAEAIRKVIAAYQDAAAKAKKSDELFGNHYPDVSPDLRAESAWDGGRETGLREVLELLASIYRADETEGGPE